MYYIQTAEHEGDEAVELPLEADYTLAMTTLTAQYPGASGLKYRSENGGWRGLRVTDGKVYQVDSNWGNATYIAVYPKDNKRKGDSDIEADNPNSKAKRVDSKQRCSDLIVLGLPWKTDEDDLKTFFGQFGELVMSQVKKDPKTSQSKGYGFIRFKDYEVQQKVTAQRHCIDGRWCDVRIPNSKGGEMMTQYSRKIFVGRVSEELTKTDLKDYFSKFGEVTDVFIPTPHRAFAFVTFVDPSVAQELQDAGEDHLIKGCSVNISNATAKNPDRPRGGNNFDQNGYPGNAPGHGHGGGGDYGGFGYGYGQSGYGANSGPNGARGPGGAAGGMPHNAGGGGGGGMDMNSMMNMNPAMMQSMMQMMMMSGMMGGGGGGGGNFGGASGSQVGAPGTDVKPANGAAASKPDGGYGYGWSNDGKSAGGGGYGTGGYGTGWGASGWGK